MADNPPVFKSVLATNYSQMLANRNLPSRSLTASLPLKSYQNRKGKAKVFQPQFFWWAFAVKLRGWIAIRQTNSPDFWAMFHPKGPEVLRTYNLPLHTRNNPNKRNAPLKTDMTSWKITIFNTRYIFKLVFFHCHVSFLGCSQKPSQGPRNDLSYGHRVSWVVQQKIGQGQWWGTGLARS